MTRRLFDTLNSAANTATPPPNTYTGSQTSGFHGSYLSITLLVLLGVSVLFVITWIISVTRKGIFRQQSSTNPTNDPREPGSHSNSRSQGQRNVRSSVHPGRRRTVNSPDSNLSSIIIIPVKHTVLVVQPDGLTVLAIDSELWQIDVSIQVGRPQVLNGARPPLPASDSRPMNESSSSQTSPSSSIPDNQVSNLRRAERPENLMGSLPVPAVSAQDKMGRERKRTRRKSKSRQKVTRGCQTDE